MDTIIGVMLFFILPTSVLCNSLAVPANVENLVSLDKPNIETINRETRKALLTTVVNELSSVRREMERLRPQIEECQKKMMTLMGSCAKCVNKFCENRYRQCKGIAKVVVPARGGVSISSVNRNGRKAVTVCTVLPRESESCQTIMNPDGVVVQSISNMGNALKVHMRGAVSDLGGNVGSFVNGMQTVLGNYDPLELNATLNETETRQLLSELDREYRQIAHDMRQQFQNMGRAMSRGMNQFASQMTRGMSQLSRSMSNMGSNFMLRNPTTFGNTRIFGRMPNIRNNWNGQRRPQNGGSVNNLRRNTLNQRNGLFTIGMGNFNVNGNSRLGSNSANNFVQTTTGIPNVLNINSVVHQRWDGPRNIQSSSGNTGSSLGSQISDNVNQFTTDLEQQISSLISNIFGKRRKRAATPPPTSIPDPGGVPVRHSTLRVPVRHSTIGLPVRHSTIEVPVRHSTIGVPLPTTADMGVTTRTSVKPQVTTPRTTRAGGIPIGNSHTAAAYISSWTTIAERTTTTITPPTTTAITTTPFVQIIRVKEDPTGAFSVRPVNRTSYVKPKDRKSIKPLKLIVKTTPMPDCGTIVLDSSSCLAFRDHCKACADHIDDKKGNIMKEVCGSNFVSTTSKLRETIKKLTEIQLQIISYRDIIQKIEYVSTNVQSNTFSLPSVYVTAMVQGKPFIFRSKTPIKLLNMQQTGQELAEQLWSNWFSGETLL